MSDQNTTETTNTETSTPVATKKARTKVARATVKLESIKALAAERGLEARETKSFLQYGHKGGVSVDFPKTEDVSRGYVRNAQPGGENDAFERFSEEQRKEQGLGAVTAEIDFAQGEEAALAAIVLALDAAKNAPAPVKVEAKPKAEKKAKEPKAAASEPATESETTTDASA